MEQMSVGEKAKELGASIFGIIIIIGILCIPVLFIMGSKWAAEHLMQPLYIAGWIALAIDIFILLPLSIFRGLRGITGTGIFISSFVFGLITWLLGFILTYLLWGFWGVFIGVLLFGGAVVPFALLATLLKGMWAPFFTVLVLVVLTFGSRLVGMLLAESSEK